MANMGQLTRDITNTAFSIKDMAYTWHLVKDMAYKLQMCSKKKNNG